MAQISIWNVFEAAIESQHEAPNPLWDVTISVRFVSPTGRVKYIEAFWDGGYTWRVRFSPDQLGTWSWQVMSSYPLKLQTNELGGEFDCISSPDDNLFFVHGRVHTSKGSTHLTHQDGTPFFWLVDTAWNGALLSSEEDWREYLEQRRQQRFTGVQFVTTEGCYTPSNREGEIGMTARSPLQVNPTFFQRLDKKIMLLNQYGLLAVPVMFWSWHELDPGQTLSESDAVRLARYMVARWGAYHVAWILSGDGVYSPEVANRWKRIGRAVFSDRSDNLVTMHPQGVTWVGELFADEDWYNFIGYQSGHGDTDEHLNWLVAGPPAHEWRKQPRLPIINLEPNYEGHPIYYKNEFFTDVQVRRAVYWSLLVSPTAGASYGHMAIWGWQEHESKSPCYNVGRVPGWRSGLDSPGLRSLTLLRAFFDRIPWWTLQPLPELILQPDAAKTPSKFIAVSRTADSKAIVAYFPEGGSAVLQPNILPETALIHWFNPITGEWITPTPLNKGCQMIEAPSDTQDWLLYLEIEAVY
jgi:hypothetical protein